jgi:hypothetical protein
MTISMPDSITPANLPGGYPAYLGYVDGEWATANEVRKDHPAAHVVALTVDGATLAADGVDSEKGDLTAVGAALWVHRKLAAEPGSRPVVYASMEGDPGYGMPWVIAELLKLGIHRAQYRILTAHYTEHAHVCSPETCQVGGQPIGFTADGTQWTSSYLGVGGKPIDMSLLDDHFFSPPADWVFGPVRSLTARGGIHSVALTWYSPGEPAPGAVHHYQVTIRHGGQDVASYPRLVPHGANPATWQGGGLEPGQEYTAMVRACAVDGHCSPWAVANFRTSG